MRGALFLLLVLSVSPAFQMDIWQVLKEKAEELVSKEDTEELLGHLLETASSETLQFNGYKKRAPLIADVT